MAEPPEPEAFLAQLRSERASGCVTITSSDGTVARLYLLGGRVFHAVAPDATGDAAIAKALSWATPDLSFDPDAELPEAQTVTDTGSLSEEAGGPRLGRLSMDRRLVRIGHSAMTVFIAMCAVPIALIGAAVVVGHFGGDADLFFVLGALAPVVLFATWLFLYLRFRVLFLRDAVSMPDVSSEAIPLVFDSPGLVHGKPTLVITMQTRSTLGRHGRCRVELYQDGLQIWRGPAEPEPRWQLAYRDLDQVEAVDVFSIESFGNNVETFVRLIARRPRMAFLFGGGWISVVTRQNRNAALLVGRLERQGVASFDDETLEA